MNNWSAPEQPAARPHVQVRQVDGPFGAALLYLVEVDLQTAAQLLAAYEPLQTSAAAFVGAPDPLGLYAADPDKQITLLWEADEPYTASLTSYIHLIDPDGRRVAQIDKLPGNGSYPTTAWTVGERVFDRYYPSILDPCTGGIPLRAKVGWYALAEDHAPRPRADAPGDTALAGVVTLLSFSHAPGYLQPQVSNEQPVTNELSFLGFNFTGSDLEPGSPIVVDLYWRSDHAGGSHPPSAALPIAMRLDNDGVSTAIWQGELAMSDWDPGKELCRRVRLQIPVDTPPEHIPYRRSCRAQHRTRFGQRICWSWRFAPPRASLSSPISKSPHPRTSSTQATSTRLACSVRGHRLPPSTACPLAWN